ncbi:zinc-ribbon domain-containing protein [Candidatus Pacearchaeota archaeon]|nr:zinc-ribbon domain-containing protein [Candidatus Pacearchaeota archaeon]
MGGPSVFPKMNMEGFDLTRYQNDEKEQEKIAKIIGKVMSGRGDYTAVIEKREEKVKRCECGWPIESGVKFCSECGKKIPI